MVASLRGPQRPVEEAEGHRGFAFLPPCLQTFLPTLGKPLLSSAGVTEFFVGDTSNHHDVLALAVTALMSLGNPRSGQRNDQVTADLPHQ